MKRMSRMSIWTGVMAMAVLVSACDNSAERQAPRTNENVGVTTQATEAVTDAGRTVGDAVLNGGRAADAAFETADVKSALSADARVNAGDINVDTDHISKTVTLKGRVPTAAQKTLAEEITVRRAVGYRVENQLTVGT